MSIQWGKTPRGHVVGTFVDRYGTPCTLQVSTLSGAIWFGTEARHVFALPDGTCRDFELPDAAQCVSRMHLTQEQVALMLPVLNYFVKHGTLPPDGDYRSEEQKVADVEVLREAEELAKKRQEDAA